MKQFDKKYESQLRQLRREMNKAKRYKQYREQLTLFEHVFGHIQSKVKRMEMNWAVAPKRARIRRHLHEHERIMREKYGAGWKDTLRQTFRKHVTIGELRREARVFKDRVDLIRWRIFELGEISVAACDEYEALLKEIARQRNEEY